MDDARSHFENTAQQIRSALEGHERRRLAPPGYDRAAVLLPILHRPHGPAILFTRRSEAMKHHKGQISFPGGRAEEGEELRRTALREASEEVRLSPELVEVPGALDDQPSVTGFVVTPYVGLVRNPPREFQVQEAEVTGLFEVPLPLLLDRDRYRLERWHASRLPPQTPESLERLVTPSGDFDRADRRYHVHFFDATPHSPDEIWGLTARILKDLLDRAFGFSRDDGA